MNQEQLDLEQRMARIDPLIRRIEECRDPEALAAAREVVQTLLDVHAAGLSRMLELAAGDGDGGRAWLQACAGDELVRSLLLLHELHPEDLATRVGQALASVRPYLNSHGGDVELIDLRDGVVKLRMKGSCDGCPSSRATLELAIERAILDAAPDVARIEVEGMNAPATPSAVVQLELGAATT